MWPFKKTPREPLVTALLTLLGEDDWERTDAKDEWWREARTFIHRRTKFVVRYRDEGYGHRIALDQPIKTHFSDSDERDLEKAFREMLARRAWKNLASD